MKDWNEWTRAWFLITEHAVVDLRALYTVTCKTCNQIYNSYDRTDSYDRVALSKSIQGHDICAWSVQLPDGRWVIHCGCGSSYDLKEFWYIKDFPIESIDGICDWCILRMLRNGIIVDSGKECTVRYDGYIE